MCLFLSCGDLDFPVGFVYDDFTGFRWTIISRIVIRLTSQGIHSIQSPSTPLWRPGFLGILNDGSPGFLGTPYLFPTSAIVVQSCENLATWFWNMLAIQRFKCFQEHGTRIGKTKRREEISTRAYLESCFP